jgi:dCMP deaminase
VTLVNSNVAVVAYVASPHDGYLQFFRAHKGAVLYLLGREFIDRCTPLRRHLPGNAPEDAVCMVRALGIFADVQILTLSNVLGLRQYRELVLPDEDVSRALTQEYLRGCNVRFDGRWRLRWHKDAALEGRTPAGEIQLSREEFAVELMEGASNLAERSPDWWRQIGALLVRDGEIILSAYNRHYPSEQMAYILGDPRSNFEAGEHIEMSVSGHAEAALVAIAARKGIKTEGCDMFVTTFPCVPCATSCALSGLRRLYYVKGYSLIHGADTLRAAGVEMFRVIAPGV